MLNVEQQTSKTPEVIYIKCITQNCNNLTPRGRLHCDEHLKVFKPKYDAYKKITKKIQKYLDDPTLLDRLTPVQMREVATKFHIAAHLRKEFQEEAIRVNRRDAGHKEIITKMLQISNNLFKRLEEPINEEEDNDEDSLIEDADEVISDNSASSASSGSSASSASSASSSSSSKSTEEDDIDSMIIQGIKENVEAMSECLDKLKSVIKEMEERFGIKVNDRSIEVLALTYTKIIVSAVESRYKYPKSSIVVQIVVDMLEYTKLMNLIPSSKEFQWTEYIAIGMSKNEIPDPSNVLTHKYSKEILRVLTSILAGLRIKGPTFVCNIGYNGDITIELDASSTIQKRDSIVYSKKNLPGITTSLCLKLS